MFLLHVLVITIVIWYLVKRWQSRHERKLYNEMKTDLKSWPLLGHSLVFAGSTEDLLKGIDTMGRDAIKHGGSVCLWFCHKLKCMTADPLDAEVIMKICLEKEECLTVTKHLLGNGGIFAPVPIWRPRRKLLAPTFNVKRIAEFGRVHCRQSQILADQLETIAGKGTVALWDYITAYSVDSIGETVLGLELNAQKNQVNPFPKALLLHSSLSARRIAEPWLANEFLYSLLNLRPTFMKLTKFLKDYISNKVSEKNEAFRKNNNYFDVHEDRPKAFVEYLIESTCETDKYRDVVINEEVMVMFVAGTDSSAVGISYTVSLLARHQNVQEKLYKELKDYYGNSGKPVAAEDFPHLPYMDAVLKESLRLYPPVPLIARKIDQYVPLPSGKTLIPGMGAFINLWMMHRNPKYWGSDAEVFRPERFLEEEHKNPVAFMPFSRGTRNCLEMLFQIILLALALCLVAQWWLNRNVRQVVKQFKTDFRSFPFVGSSHIFIGDGKKKMRTLQELGRQAFRYGGWTGLWIGHFHTLVADPIEAEYVMKNHLEKADVLKVTRDLLGDASIFAPVAIWKPRRKILMPSFKQRNLNEFMHVFSKQSSILVHQLSEVANGKRFSIWNYFTSYTMDVVCQTTLGVDIGVQKQQDQPFLKWVREYATITAKRLMLPWLRNDYAFKYLRFWDMYPLSQECVKGITGFVLDIVHSKQAELKHKELNDKCNNSPNNKIDDDYNDEPKHIKPLLELLIESSGRENGYTDTELREETQMIVGAGTDTSAAGISFVAMMLANHPDVQDKVYKELKEIYGDSDRPVTAEDVLQMHYLEMVIKETLRLYPPVPITARKILHDDVTPAGIKLVSGISVVINHWAIHRNPKYWGPDADLFRPERFADCPPTQPSAYMPFSHGPRNCIGFVYAMMSIKAAVSSVVRQFHILPADPDEVDKPLRVTYEVMMKHTGNFELRLESRKR